MPSRNTEHRKDDHLRITLEEDVSFRHLTTGLERLQLIHQALPELDLAAIDTSTSFLGHHLSMPVLIASLTGGTERAAEINRALAEAAQEQGIGMGLGSMRAALEEPDVAWTFQVRRHAPDILLLANLGAVQLNYGYGVDECRQVVDLIEADALYLHLNPLQEALQPEGDTRFAGLLRRIELVCRALPVPVIVKEVGWGLSARVARLLADVGVAGLDVAGGGGTSWSQVEMHRSEDEVQREVATSFRDWGIPTAEAIRTVRDLLPGIPLIASGGLESGIDVAKCIALGADIAALARPLLRAAAISPQALRDHIEVLRRQLRISMFATASSSVTELRHAELVEL